MTKQHIRIGDVANDRTGDPLREAFRKVNENFDELYAASAADVTDRLVNGEAEVVLDEIGVLTVPGTIALQDGIISSNDNTDPGIVLGSSDKSVFVRTLNGVDQYNWKFGTDGILTLPDGTILDSYLVKAATDSNYVIRTRETGVGNRDWQFGVDGNLSLPAGGDIVDSTGASVLGSGGANTGNFTFTNSAASVPVNSTLTLTAFNNTTKESKLTLSPTTTSSLYAANNLELGIAYGTGFEKYWLFGADGSIRFPDASIQSTAYTGAAPVSALVNSIHTVSLGSDGVITLPATGTVNNFLSAISITVVPNNLAQTVSTVIVDKSGPPNSSWGEIQLGWTIAIGLVTRTVIGITDDVSNVNFELDGSLTLPGTGSVTFQSFGSKVLELSPDGTTQWTFEENGALTLPTNGTITYSANPSVWAGTPPTTIQEAIDRLAEAFKILNNGTGA